MKLKAPALILSLAFAVQPAFAKMYKWVDEQGNVYYSDKIPPKAIQGSHSAISKGGVTIEQTGAAKSAEEIERERQIKLMQEEAQKQLAEQQAKDKVLLNTFRTEDDILLARDGKLATYDAQIRIVYENIELLKARLVTYQAKAANAERLGKAVDKLTMDGINNTQQEIKDSYASILRQETDKKMIVSRYAEDLERFRKLKELENSTLAQATTDKPVKISALVETMIRCDSDDQCNHLWKVARDFASKQQTTSVYADAEKIYMTKPATKDGEIAITLSRLQPRKDDKDTIFLDVQCVKVNNDDTWCNNEKAAQIRKAFKVLMTTTKAEHL